MTYRKQLLITTAVLAMVPLVAQAAPVSWLGTTSNAWGTAGNWSPSGIPGATAGVTIGNNKNNPVQLNVNSSLNGSGGSLTINSGESLALNSGKTLTMGANPLTLSGSLTGPGTLSIGTASASGTENLSGGTLGGLTITGAAGGLGGLWNVTADSTLTGAIAFTADPQTFAIGGGNGIHTLNLDSATLTSTSPGSAAFNIGSGGTLNNKNKASSINTAGTIALSGGSITNTSGQGGTTAGTLTIVNPVSGNGTISGNVALTSTAAAGLTASGGTLTLNGGGGVAGTGVVLGSGLTAVATGSTLDLQGAIGVPGSMTMNPGAGGLIKFDGANFAATGATGAINTNATATAGTFDVVGPNTTSFTGVAFSAGSGASFLIDAPLNLVDAASSVSAKTVSLNGQTVSGLGTLTGTTAINSTSTSTLAAPFAGAALNVSSGTLDIKSVGTSTGTSTVSTKLNIDTGGSWTAGTVTNNGTINDAGGWTTTKVTNNSTINVNVGGKWTLPNALTALTNNGTINLSGGTIQGPSGFFNSAGMFGAGAFDVTANSTLQGNLTWDSTGNTFNIGGALGGFTLNLDTSILSTVSGSTPFLIGSGGTLNNANGASSMGGGGTVTLTGGSITTTGGSLKVGDAISGYGSVSGNVNIASSVTAAGAGKTLTVDGGSGAGLQLGNSSGSGAVLSSSSGATLDLKGNLSLIEPATAGPGTGTIQFDGANFTNAFSSSPVSMSGSGTGTFDVVGPNSSTLNNVAFSTGSGANLKVDAPLTVKNGASVNAANTTVSGTGALNLVNTTGTTTLTTHNLTLAQGSTLNVGAGHNAISLTGNFSYQQTDTINGWTNGGTAGLGPNLIMTGGTSSSPTTLEVGSVNKGGYNPAAWNQNFALSSLTLGTGAYDKLVDAYQNATPSGWTSGSEVLYLDGLFGVTPGSGHVIPTLNLMGIEAFLLTQSGNGGFLYNGLYTDPNGGEVNIIGASPAPEPAALLLFGSGLAGLALVRRRRA